MMWRLRSSGLGFLESVSFQFFAPETTPHRLFPHSSMRMLASPSSTSHSPTGGGSDAAMRETPGWGGAMAATALGSKTGAGGATFAAGSRLAIARGSAFDPLPAGPWAGGGADVPP